MPSEPECTRLAVTEGYGARLGFTLEDTPDAAGDDQNAAWEAFATARGLAWWWSDEVAPVSQPRWLAFVPSRQEGAPLHCVVMRFQQVAFDPPIGDDRPWTAVRKEDVRYARMLLREDDPTWGKPLQCWEINRG